MSNSKSAWDKLMKSQAAWDSKSDPRYSDKPEPPKTSMAGVQKGQREFEPDPDSKSPSGLKPVEGSGAGSVMGFQMPGNLVKRKRHVDELLKQNPGFNEQLFSSYVQSLPEGGADMLCNDLDTLRYSEIADKMKEFAIREIIRKKVREVVRKKPGGGGYALYAPNKGKKGKSKKVGEFPTRLGARRAELARFPPKDPEKLKRARKALDKMTKNPKKAADAEKKAVRKEALEPVPGSQASVQSRQSGINPNEKTPQTNHKDLAGFMSGLKTLPKDGPERGKYITKHMSDPQFMSNLQQHPQGKQLHKMMTDFLNSPKNAGPTGGKVTISGESVKRRMDFMERKVLSKVIYKSLVEGMFREEKKGSDWDQYIGKLSKQALAGDGKFQSLQKAISKKEDTILGDAFDSIRKAVGKIARLKNFGVKKDAQTNKTYLAFGAEFEGVNVEPILIHIENGTPHIEVTDNARVALTKIEPTEAKMFRAELVTVQEGILDEMDDLVRAVSNRDKYLQKLEGGIDAYVAEMSPLQVSLLKNLLVKKYKGGKSQS